MTSMRVDVVSIFPDYLAPLGLSLLARAQADGLLSVHIHDLREWTHDRHRTVDDSPYGGGAGMVMRPEPWGEALDDLLAHGSAAAAMPTLVIPSPAGVRFEQQTAAALAARPWLVFACGRYEGIDQRVSEHFSPRMEVLEVSVGDYVLNGGEVAALVMIEAVARLLPGFVGNPASLVEESHAAAPGLLEYPVYTKPRTWRGLKVPEVLLSGDHGRIEAWRHGQALRRTAQRRPDLAHPSQTLRVVDLATEAEVRLARPADAGELLTLQRCCWVSEAQLNDALRIPPLVESLDDVRSALDDWLTVTVRVDGRLVASVRARRALDGAWEIGRLMVAPDLEGRGLGRHLLAHIEEAAPPEATSYRLFTGARSERNLRMYRKAGYRRAPDGEVEPEPGVVTLVKRARPTSEFG
ncbi:MAG: tRNA (guanosine(37)-N1)-methyltransferase TrmD [Nocardioidaceae bacterium]